MVLFISSLVTTRESRRHGIQVKLDVDVGTSFTSGTLLSFRGVAIKISTLYNRGICAYHLWREFDFVNRYFSLLHVAPVTVDSEVIFSGPDSEYKLGLFNCFTEHHLSLCMPFSVCRYVELNRVSYFYQLLTTLVRCNVWVWSFAAQLLMFSFSNNVNISGNHVTVRKKQELRWNGAIYAWREICFIQEA